MRWPQIFILKIPLISLIRLPGSGAHISWVALCQSATKSFCGHLKVRQRKCMALKVLFHDVTRMVVELDHFVAVNILLVFSRASVDIGNNILIPGFYIKFNFCFFSRVSGDFSFVCMVLTFHKYEPSLGFTLSSLLLVVQWPFQFGISYSSVSGICIFFVVICFYFFKHLFVCLFVSVYVWACMWKTKDTAGVCSFLPPFRISVLVPPFT